MAKVGDRVFAVQSADENTVKLIGFGVYAGDITHPGLGFPNPKIELDGGGVAWGFECWWGSEDKFKDWAKDRAIEHVPPVLSAENIPANGT